MNNTKQNRNSETTSKTSKSIIDKYLQYISENLIKSSSVLVLLIGSLMLLVFFLRIGYMPDVNIESISSILYAVAFLGLFITTYTMFMMILPGLVLATAKEMTEEVHNGHLLCIAGGAATIWTLWLLHLFEVFVFQYIAILWTTTILIALGAAALGVLISRTWPKKLPADTNTNDNDNTKKHSPRKNPGIVGVGSFFMTLIVAAIFIFPLAFITIIGMNGDIQNASGSDAAFRLASLIFVISMAATAIAASKPSEHYKFASIIALPLLFFGLYATGAFSSIPMMTVKILGQGEISSARISITGKTCREIVQTLGQRVCQDDAADDAVTMICPVILRSRIGSQAVLDFAPIGFSEESKLSWMITQGTAVDKGKKGLVHRVILNKDKLLSWQPLSPLRERNAESTERSTSPRVGTWMDLNKSDVFKTDRTLKTAYGQLLSDNCGLPPALRTAKP